ncbi:nucleotidyltransferase domain-containing protein [Candidatus Gottesmanbacteria bacterium]|nr:nucleotidyltransferase domain-containing protein [Candidatus Gottesmanbacteria bacterium]
MSLGLQKQIKTVASSVLPTGFKLGLFGSRTKGTPSKFSDVDLAVIGEKKAPGHILESVREVMEKSPLPYRVDVVDLNSVSETFRKNILREIVWL